jgi:uncharacterized membrane protein
MKNEVNITKIATLILLFATIIWQLATSLSNATDKSAQLPKQLLSFAFLIWAVYILSKSNQDDDDWAY